MSDNRSNFYALLVAVNDYKHPRIPDLSGCENDVNAMEQLLRDKFKIPAENIKKLVNQEATHQGIKDAFKNHLIAKATEWADGGKQGDPPAFLYHYSGHGSQAPDDTGTEPDGLDETMVPHDSRTEGIYDIKDWELGGLISQLTKHTDNVTIILDACHSGGGTKAVSLEEDPTKAPTRRCEPDLRPQPTQRPVSAIQSGTRSIGTPPPPSGWHFGEKYVLLSGCKDNQESNEHIIKEDNKYVRYGALTYHLVQELSKMSPDRPLTYRELHQRVSQQVTTKYQSQNPQCEGDRDREIFGGIRPDRDISLTVIDNSRGFIWVNGGIAHGLTVGSQLKAYPPELRVLRDATPLATLKVEKVSTTQCGCVVEDGQADIPLNARTTIHRLNYGNLKKQVVLDIPEGNLKDELKQYLAHDSVTPYVSVSDTDVAADFRIQLAGKTLEIQDPSGKLLVAPFPFDKIMDLANDLCHLVRYQNALALQSSTANMVNINIKKLVYDSDPLDHTIESFETLPSGEITVEAATQITEGGEDDFLEGDELVIEVTNHSKSPLYFSIFHFGSDWSVTRMYPEGGQEQILPGKAFKHGIPQNDEDEPIGFFLPPEINEATEVLKVIATVNEADFEILQQGPLKQPFETRSVPKSADEDTSAFNALLEQTMNGGNKRAFGTISRKKKFQWATDQIKVRIVQPTTNQGNTRSIQAEQTTTLPGYEGFELQAPTGFSGQVKILTETQNTRSVNFDATDLSRPAGLARFNNTFMPMGLSATRESSPAGAVIEIEADEMARNQVTAQTPLKMTLPPQMIDDESTPFMLAYDGNFYYPVGRPNGQKNEIDIEWLPDPMPEDEKPLRSTRSLGRTVKLYLYKSFNWPEPSLGLHSARFVSLENLDTDPPTSDERCETVADGEVRYRQIQANELKAGQKVALFVHGLTSDTLWAVQGPAQFFAQNGIKYDHVLTFDYETFNTHIADNGQTLANALRKLGFSATDNIHLDVFAHSMGTLVTRSMVELWGGDEFVDRCFLAGPPNHGSRLAEAKRFVPWLSTLMVNNLITGIPALVTGWVLKRVTDDAIGVDDLRPTSEFIQQLNASTKTATVPYFILAGHNEIPTAQIGAWQNFVNKLKQGTDTSLDFIFNDQHDLAIGLESMKTVRGGNYPQELLDVKVLPCDHFGYFSSKEGKQQFLTWLTA